jgi:hypothetical protein
MVAVEVCHHQAGGTNRQRGLAPFRLLDRGKQGLDAFQLFPCDAVAARHDAITRHRIELITYDLKRLTIAFPSTFALGEHEG